MRPDGYAQIIGRIKDMIIRGGENIYPTEVENFLMELPGVLEAQVRCLNHCKTSYDYTIKTYSILLGEKQQAGITTERTQV